MAKNSVRRAKSAAVSDGAESAPSPALANIWWSCVTVFGFVGVLLAFLEKLDHIIVLSGWAKFIVDHWRAWTVDFWHTAVGVTGLPVPGIMIPGLMLSIFVLMIAIGGRLTAHATGDSAAVQRELAAEMVKLEKQPGPTVGKVAVQLLVPFLSREFWRSSTWLNPFMILALAFLLTFLIGTDAPQASAVKQRFYVILFCLGMTPGALAYLILPATRLDRLLWSVIVGLAALIGLSYASAWLPLLKGG